LQKDQAYGSSKEALAKALQLDENIGEAHDTFGVLNWRFDWDWNAAEREFDRAIALAPSYTCAHEDRAIFLAFRGRRAEALDEIRQIDQLDFGFSSAISESLTYYELRDYPRLIEASKRGLILDSQDSFQHYLLGVGYEGVGDLPQAISEYKKAIEISSGSDLAAVALAHADSASGKKAEAWKILHDLQHKEISASPYTMATVYALLDENDKALEFLEKACSGKSLDLTLFLRL